MTRKEFEIKSQQCRPIMLRVAYAILADREEAADAVQDALLKLWRGRESLATVSNPSAYFNIAVRNAAMDIYGHRCRSEVSFNDGAGLPDSKVHADAETRTDASMVMKAIDALPDNSRMVMRLSAIAGLSSKEIADMTGMTDMNVRTILSRTRKKLKELFEK